MRFVNISSKIYVEHLSVKYEMYVYFMKQEL